ncbi:MAG: patatin-like phospholipase family protein [Actinomycetes bacterium]
MARSSRTSPLDYALDIFRVKQYFGVALEVREWARTVREDAASVDLVVRAALGLPVTGTPAKSVDHTALPPFLRRGPSRLQGRRVAVVSSGGSGALASLIGLGRAFEETDVTVAQWSLCSGGALFGFPLAAGMSADETAAAVLAMTARDLVDVDWAALARAPWRLGRGLTGLLRGEQIERSYHALLGDLTLRELAVPAYVPIWDVEHNRLEYLGPSTYPDVPVARAVRMAVSLPPVFQPTDLGGRHWCDGGLVDILPVHPVLDLAPPPDVAVVVNAFYPPGLRGEEADGWDSRRLAILELAGQARTSQHVQLARENLARLRSEVPEVLLVEPVPYDKVRGTGFYRQFIDPADWSSFIRAGHDAALTAVTR